MVWNFQGREIQIHTPSDMVKWKDVITFAIDGLFFSTKFPHSHAAGIDISSFPNYEMFLYGLLNTVFGIGNLETLPNISGHFREDEKAGEMGLLLEIKILRIIRGLLLPIAGSLPDLTQAFSQTVMDESELSNASSKVCL